MQIKTEEEKTEKDLIKLVDLLEKYHESDLFDGIARQDIQNVMEKIVKKLANL